MMECCNNHEVAIEEDDFSVNPDRDSSDVSDPSGSGNDSQTRNSVPYSRCTPLFRAIEVQDWEGVLLFLNTGKWSNSMWNSSIDHLKSPTAHIQCKTWVVSYKKGKEEWCQLPIHAAISYGAPSVVIQKLVEMYPESIKARDGEGMLPVHLAFGFGSNDTILGFLLRSWPASVNEVGPHGRLPHECCDLGPNKQRGEVYRIVADQTGMAVQQSHDELWTRCVMNNSKRLGLKDQNLQKRHLTDLLTELLEDRAQLQDLKDKLKMKYGAQSGSTTLKSVGSAPKMGGSGAAATSLKATSPPTSPRNGENDALKIISPPSGKGSNPPWMLEGSSHSRRAVSTRTVRHQEVDPTVNASMAPTKQGMSKFTTKSKIGWKRGGKKSTSAQ